MLLDERTEFCDATALSTSGTGRANIGDVIPLGQARDIGHGEPVYLVIQVTTAVTSGGAASVSFILCSDDSASISTSTATDHIETAAIAKATLVAGYEFVIPLPDGDYEEYLGLQQNVTSNALTAGAVNAFLTTSPRRIKAYADGDR